MYVQSETGSLVHAVQAVLPSRYLFGAHHHYVVLVIALLAVCPILLIGNFRLVTLQLVNECYRV